MSHFAKDPAPSFWKSSAGLTLLVAAMVGGFYLVTEHRAHLFGWLPYLILVACPLMHVFMNKGNGHGGHRHSGHDHKAWRISLRRYVHRTEHSRTRVHCE